MPVPVVVGAVAALAARLAAKKAVTRTVGGITGKGAAKINPIYKQTIPSASVKVLPPMSDIARASANVRSAIRASNASSGAGARGGGAHAEKFYATQPKPKNIKINSNK